VQIPVRQLGAAGPQLSCIGLGTWATGGPGRFGWGPVNDEDSIAAIQHGIDSGINWIDTAPIYGQGHAEEVVGRALQTHSAPTDVYVFTKCGRRDRPDGARESDLRPESIRAECDDSLRRLRVEQIDLYQIHWPDADSGTPLEESWAAMADLVDAGKVRWIGVSNFTVDQLARCEEIRHVDSVQAPLSMLQRGSRKEVMPWAAMHGIGFLAYSPLASGLLTGAFDRKRLDTIPSDDFRQRSPLFVEPAVSRNLELVERLRGVCEEIGARPQELAVAWTLSHDSVTGAIVGARRPEQLREWIGAANLTLSEETMEQIEVAIVDTGAGTDELPAPPRGAGR
jgi:aryl-alcohol dehydrogenase-like predicted oxidoreductase